MARPPSGLPRKKRIAITLSPDIMDAIKEMANKNKMSVSAIAEKLFTIGITCPHCNQPPNTLGKKESLSDDHI